MKRPSSAKPTVRQLSTTELARVTGGDNPGMGPYDPPPPPPQGTCWVSVGSPSVYMPNSVLGVDCDLVYM